MNLMQVINVSSDNSYKLSWNQYMTSSWVNSIYKSSFELE